MSKRFILWQRSLTLAALTGSALAFNGCANNAEFANLIANSGTASINALSDSSFFNDKGKDSDYDLIVRQPLTALFNAAWRNYVFNDLPADPSVSTLLEK